LNMSKRPTQATLEAIVRDIGHTIAGAVKEAAALEGAPIGFAFFLFDFGEDGSMAYAANARRPDVVALLEELAAKIRAEGN
jgi:hypothetical protein